MSYQSVPAVVDTSFQGVFFKNKTRVVAWPGFGNATQKHIEACLKQYGNNLRDS